MLSDNEVRSISTPRRLETSIGEPASSDLAPTHASAERLYDYLEMARRG
jgi:hypothetical protein